MLRMVKLERPCQDVVSLAIPTPFSVGDVNVYLLEGKSLTLVDTGPNTEEAWDTLVSGIEAAGYKISDLEQIVLTHFHEDHTGLANKLKEETGALILAHPATAVWLQEEDWFVQLRAQFYAELYKKAGLPEQFKQKIISSYEKLRKYGETCVIDSVLEEGQKLEAHPEWEVIYTPGHSQTQFSLYRAADQTMILADHLIAHTSSNAILEPTVRPDEERVKTLIQYRKELKKLKEMPVKTGLSGHGEPIYDHVTLIEKRFDSHKRRGDKIVSLLQEKEQSAADLALKLFPNRMDQLPLILSETIGHLDLLEAQGRIQKTSRNGVEWFSQLNLLLE